MKVETGKVGIEEEGLSRPGKGLNIMKKLLRAYILAIQVKNIYNKTKYMCDLDKRDRIVKAKRIGTGRWGRRTKDWINPN